jgi:Double-GTPase 2
MAFARLPGEWSTDLIKDASVAERFAFLRRADGIVITLDGPMLNGGERHAAAQNAKLLITRLADTLDVDRSLPFVLMVTKGDEVSMEVPTIVTSIKEHAEKAGFVPKIIPVAAISRASAQVKSGTGVMDVVEYILGRNAAWNLPEVSFTEMPEARHFARIRG